MIAFHTPAEGVALRALYVRPAASSTNGLTYAPALSFPHHTSVQQVLDTLRHMRPDTMTIAYLFVTGESGRMIGTLTLHQLIVAPADTRIGDLVSPHFIALRDDLSPAQQAQILSNSGLIALPVIDAEGRLVGALDASDLLDTVKDSATKDMYLLAGMHKAEAMSRPISQSAHDRRFWLVIHLALMFVAALLISRFQNLITQTAILAAFIPVVTGQGTYIGTQSLTFIVRALALGEVRLGKSHRLIGREVAIAIINGLTIGLIVGLIGWLWQGLPILGLIVGIAMIGNLILSALIGTLIPLAFKALRIDPALGSAIIVTAIPSIAGTFILFSLAMIAHQLGYL